jgi:hypothetical protein
LRFHSVGRADALCALTLAINLRRRAGHRTIAAREQKPETMAPGFGISVIRIMWLIHQEQVKPWAPGFGISVVKYLPVR